jgi:hypothetical protein
MTAGIRTGADGGEGAGTVLARGGFMGESSAVSEMDCSDASSISASSSSSSSFSPPRSITSISSSSLFAAGAVLVEEVFLGEFSVSERDLSDTLSTSASSPSSSSLPKSMTSISSAPSSAEAEPGL